MAKASFTVMVSTPVDNVGVELTFKGKTKEYTPSSFNDYYNMADIVVDYMNEHGKAPDSINYEGATIGYYDLVYNFALLTEDDTSASTMNFPSEMAFYKYYRDLLFELLPIGMIIVAIILILLIVRSIIRRIKRRIRRMNGLLGLQRPTKSVSKICLGF